MLFSYFVVLLICRSCKLNGHGKDQILLIFLLILLLIRCIFRYFVLLFVCICCSLVSYG